MYLIRRRKQKGKHKVRPPRVAHIWRGDYPKSKDGDTACKMASTGGLNLNNYYCSPTPIWISKSAEKHILPTCTMCENNR